MKKIKFDEAVENYLQFIKLKRKNDTYITKERRIKKHIVPFFRSRYLQDISIKDYLDWQIYIEHKNLKYNYKSSLHYTFTDFYSYCSLIYNVDNIAKKVGNFKNDDIENNGDIWTLNEFNQFISVIDNPIYKTLFELLYFTGLRIGEALALTFNDLKDSHIVINKTMTRFNRNNEKIITTPKTKSSNRIISIDEVLNKELEDLKKYYKKNMKYNEQYYIFGGDKSISFSTLLRKKNFYCN